jgi:hypothetical protein
MTLLSCLPSGGVDRRAKLVVAPGWIQTDTGGSEATYTVEECIPLVVDMLEKNHGKPGLRYVDCFDKTLDQLRRCGRAIH